MCVGLWPPLSAARLRLAASTWLMLFPLLSPVTSSAPIQPALCQSTANAGVSATICIEQPSSGRGGCAVSLYTRLVSAEVTTAIQTTLWASSGCQCRQSLSWSIVKSTFRDHFRSFAHQVDQPLCILHQRVVAQTHARRMFRPLQSERRSAPKFQPCQVFCECLRNLSCHHFYLYVRHP